MSDDQRLAPGRQRLAAAVRAVADDPGLDVAFDSRPPAMDSHGAHLPMPRSGTEGATWLAWRVLGDRVGALHRFPPPLRVPMLDEGRRAIFDAIWQARAEILAGQVLPGVRRNLEYWLEAHWSDDAGLDVVPLPERLRLSVHHATRASRLPNGLSAALEQWDRVRGIPLDTLVANLDQPRAYAAASLRLARGLAPSEPRADRESPPQPARRSPAATGSEGRPQPGRRPVWGMPTGIAGSMPVQVAPGARYHIYTRAHDETTRPGDLVTAQELMALRRELEQAAPQTTRLVARLARSLERRLQTLRPRGWRAADQGGQLDPRRLSRCVTDPSSRGVYRERSNALDRETVVTLLLDNSASMRGRRIRMAALCADLLVRSLERCGVTTEILGYTTTVWDGGPAAADWRAAGRPAGPGRLNARRHIIYKGADQPWRRARAGLGLMLRDELLRENIDGEALLWAAGRLSRRPERRRILIVVGDGAPRDRATAAANGDGYLTGHLASVIAGLERAGRIELLGVGIGQSVERHYRRSVTVRRIDELAATLTGELAGTLAPAAGATGVSCPRRP